MRNAPTCLGGVCLLLSTLTPWSGPAAETYGPPLIPACGTPKLVVPETDYDGGTVLKGDSIRQVYTVENRGTAPLRLPKVKTSCGCTTVRHDRVVEPGESGVVELEINTRRLRAGSFRKTATLTSNDPANTELQLTLTGEVITLLESEPALVKLALGPAETGSFELRAATDDEIFVEEIRARTGHVDILQIETLAAGRHYRVHVGAVIDTPRANSRREHLSVSFRRTNGETRIEEIPVVIEAP